MDCLASWIPKVKCVSDKVLLVGSELMHFLTTISNIKLRLYKLLDAYKMVGSYDRVIKAKSKVMLRYALTGWGGNQAISTGDRVSSDVGLGSVLRRTKPC